MNIESLIKSTALLASDLDGLGWDQSDRIYHVVGDPDDPEFRLAGVLNCPGQLELLHMFDGGLRIPEDTKGLVLTQEALRHLTLEEVLVKAPDMIDAIKESWARDHGTEIPEALIETTVQNYYYDQMLPKLPPPPIMPADMRAEIRIVTLVLEDGTCIVSHHTRDQDDACTSIADESAINETLMPGALYLFLHGLRPDAEETIDVRQAVADLRTVKAIENGFA